MRSQLQRNDKDLITMIRQNDISRERREGHVAPSRANTNAGKLFRRAAFRCIVQWVSLLCVVPLASARDRSLGVDASFQVGVLSLSEEIGEKPLGIGGRVGYELLPFLFLDGEAMHFPENPSGNFGQTLVLGGIRLGKNFDRIGIYAKARSGVVHFGGGDFGMRMADKTHPAVDLGGIVEYHVNKNVFVRVDMGECIILFDNSPYRSAISPGVARLGTKHNLLAEFGIGVRF